MTIWIPDLSGRRGPLYLAIADAIGEAVENGALGEGERLLPQREFAYRLGLTVGTVSRAIALAQKRGLVRGEVGRGSYVSGNSIQRPGLDIRPRTTTDVVDLSCFLPGGNGVTTAIADVMREVALEANLRALHRYPPGSGIWSHRIAGANWMRRFGFEARAEEVIVCPGAQQALSAIVAAITSPGDAILSEALTYSGLKQLAHLFHLRPEGIAVDEEGIVPDALEAACASSAARVLYVQPSIHNPTTAVMSAGRRKDIAAIARKFGLTVIEDASCAAFLEGAAPPLVTLVPERTCFVAGTSKSLSPSLRTAFLRSPPDLHSHIVATMHTLSLSGSALMAEVAARLVSGPRIESILTTLAGELADRHKLVETVLGQFNIQHHPAAPFAWLKLPGSWRAGDFLAATQMHDVAVAGAENFAVGRSNAPHDIRISVGVNPRHGDFRSGLESLAGLLAKSPHPQDSII